MYAAFPLTIVIWSIKFSLYKSFSIKNLILFFGLIILIKPCFFLPKQNIALHRETNLFNPCMNNVLTKLLSSYKKSCHKLYISFFNDQEKFFMSSCSSTDIEIYLKFAGVGIDSLFLDMPIAGIIFFSKSTEIFFPR